jgi:hypothetical protein
MAHTCEDCGQLCYCDIDDMEFDEAPIDCCHRCPPERDEDYEEEPPVE